jgi:hypothetical protein
MITSLKLDQFTRELWNEYDAYCIAQLEALLNDPCLKPRFYTAPDLAANLLGNTPPGVPGTLAGNNYVEYGLSITPGSLIIGTYLFSTSPTSFLAQLTDVSLDHKIFDQPVPALFLGNAKGDFPNLWDTPHPVVGSGLIRCEFWNQSPDPQIIMLVLAVLEPCDPQ